jgi:hypothetical protein
MPTTDCAGNIALTQTLIEPAAHVEDELQPTPPGPSSSKLLKVLLTGFAVSVTVGLALASWYVAARIAKTNSTHAAAAPAIPKTESAEDAMAEAYWALAPTAVPTETLYLQVAGLDPARDTAFVESLKTQGFPAQLQSGRVLIGPYASRDRLEQARAKLRSAGVLAVDKIN